jgi:RNA polymerase sigma factor (sigma-70 family)
MTDLELLHLYRSSRSHRAFEELVRRHIALVYSVARRLVRDTHQCEDITQTVFTLLAKKALAPAEQRGIPPDAPVAAWLHRTAHFTALATLRDQSRQHHHEREAAMHAPSHPAEDPSWPAIAAELDAAVDQLDPDQRAPLILRFFAGKTYPEIAAELATPNSPLTEEAARKRVDRALDLLRTLLTSRGIAISAATLAGLLLANTTHAAPPALASLIATSSAKPLAFAKLAAAALALLAIPTAIFYAFHNRPPVLPKSAPIPIAAAIAPEALADALAEPPTWTPSPADATLDVAALIRDVRSKEQWIDKARSLHIEFNDTWTRTPEGLANSQAEWSGKTVRGQAPSPQNLPELNPKLSESIGLAFDDHRLSYRRDIEGLISERTVWDGRQKKHFDKREVFPINQSIGGSPDDVLRTSSLFTGWLCPAPRSLWCAPHFSYGNPEDFRLLGRETFDNVECFVVQQYHHANQTDRWYIGVNDHLLHRRVSGTLGSPEAETAMYVDIARSQGQHFQTGSEAMEWFYALPPDQQQRLTPSEEDMHWSMNINSVPLSETAYYDYTEVRPGSWYPRRLVTLVRRYQLSGNQRRIARAPWDDTILEQIVKSISIDEPLPDSLFTLDFKEGIPLLDQTRNPAVEYIYRKDVPPDEFAKSAENSRRYLSNENPLLPLAKQLIGQNPPPLPTAALWLNSQPLTWQSFRGKPLIVEFLGDWCAQSYDNLTALQRLHEQIDLLGIQLLVVHTPAASSEVSSFLQEHLLSFPLVIDLPASPSATSPATASGNNLSWGQFADAFHVYQLPAACLIDKDGKIVELSNLAGCLYEARNRGELPHNPTAILYP